MFFNDPALRLEAEGATKMVSAKRTDVQKDNIVHILPMMRWRRRPRTK
jgi:hypothetical protein